MSIGKKIVSILRARIPWRYAAFGVVALALLGYLFQERLIVTLISLRLNSADRDAAEEAAQLLAERATADSLAALVDYYDGKVREFYGDRFISQLDGKELKAIRFGEGRLTKLGHARWKALPHLLRMLDGETDNKRSEIIRSGIRDILPFANYGAKPEEDVGRRCAAALEDDDRIIRTVATLELGRAGSTTAATGLRNLLNHRERLLRMEAATSLARMGEPAGVEHLMSEADKDELERAMHMVAYDLIWRDAKATHWGNPGFDWRGWWGANKQRIVWYERAQKYAVRYPSIDVVGFAEQTQDLFREDPVSAVGNAVRMLASTEGYREMDAFLRRMIHPESQPAIVNLETHEPGETHRRLASLWTMWWQTYNGLLVARDNEAYIVPSRVGPEGGRIVVLAHDPMRSGYQVKLQIATLGAVIDIPPGALDTDVYTPHREFLSKGGRPREHVIFVDRYKHWMSRHDSRDISRVYSFGTTGDISFKLPVTLTIAFNKFRVENPWAVDIYKLSGNARGKDSLVPMNAVVDHEKGTCALTITELGSFVVAEKE